MVIGIDYELFWRLNPKKMEAFEEAFIKRTKLNQQQDNVNAWLNGIYMSYAIASCFGKNSQYPSEPINVYNDEMSQQERLKMEAEKFEAYAIAFNNEFRKKNENVINQ